MNESIFNLGIYGFDIFSSLFFILLISPADISRNRLAKISGKAFINLSNLTYLDISYNKLSALELDYMGHLPKLQKLNISGNIQMNLLDIRPIFQNLTELRSLSMADITNMPLGIFVPLSNLQVLNISGTHLNNETLQILNPLAKLKVNQWGSKLRFLLFCQFFNLNFLSGHHLLFRIYSRSPPSLSTTLEPICVFHFFLNQRHSCQKFFVFLKK